MGVAPQTKLTVLVVVRALLKLNLNLFVPDLRQALEPVERAHLRPISLAQRHFGHADARVLLRVPSFLPQHLDEDFDDAKQPEVERRPVFLVRARKTGGQRVFGFQRHQLLENQRQIAAHVRHRVLLVYLTILLFNSAPSCARHRLF